MTELQSLISACLSVGAVAGLMGIVKAIRLWKEHDDDHESMVGVLMGQRVLPQAKIPVRRAPPPPPPAHGGVPVATAVLKPEKSRPKLATQVDFDHEHKRHAVILSDKTLVAFVCETCKDTEENLAWLACNDLK